MGRMGAASRIFLAYAAVSAPEYSNSCAVLPLCLTFDCCEISGLGWRDVD